MSAEEMEEVGPPPPSGADFYLPHRGAKALDAAEISIVQPYDDGVAALNADLARSRQEDGDLYDEGSPGILPEGEINDEL